MATFKDKIEKSDHDLEFALNDQKHRNKAREFALWEAPVREFFDEVRKYCQSEGIDTLRFINRIAVESIEVYQDKYPVIYKQQEVTNE